MGEFLETLNDARPGLTTGLQYTLILTIGGAILSLIIAFVLGLMSLSRSVLVRGISRVVVEFFRGTSLVVQLFWFVYAMPILFGLQFDDKVFAALIALGLNYGAYGAEIVRGGINAVPKSQVEATVALNFTPYMRMRKVVLPQAIVGMIPPFGNLLIQLLKGSALATLVGVSEISFEAEKIRLSDPGASATAFGISLIMYFLIALVLNELMRLWEARAKRTIGQHMPARRFWQFSKAEVN